ncbi:MAG: TonB-dependent receptor plug domain-containing protein [Pseudomonadota bacterium]
MKKLPPLQTFSSRFALLGLVAAAVSAPGAVQAQQGAEEIEEVVVTGSRGAPRSAIDAAAPVDVLSAQDFMDQGTTDMNDLMRNLVPSFNVETQDINDSNSLVRPATLRGLPADDTLILVNGKRRHRSAAIQFGQDGTHFPDTAQIPMIALQQVEVLRDGASAQYGSDAIAGVINFRLKENREGASFETKSGYYTNNGDGHLNYVAGNVGLPLGNSGFASLSFDYTNQNKTDRSIQRGDAQALIDAGNTNVRGAGTPPGSQHNVMNHGLPDTEMFNTFANMAIDLGNDQELYSFGGYSEKDVELGFFYRNPENRGGVFTAGGEQLMFDVTEDGTGNCPSIPTGVDPDTGVTSSIIASNVSANNPDCFSFTEWFPGGYTPDFGGGVVDFSNTTGIRGEFDDGTSYDVSLGNGFSEITYFLTDTTNPSMGPDSPTSFEPGIYTTIENNLNIDFVKPIEMDGLYSPLNVAYGVEWRREIFKVRSEDEDSYRIGPYADQGGGVGSDGFQGFSPQQQGSWDRKNWAFYVDLEADVTDRLLLGAALRYEDFYDSFGDTTNGKLSMRYRLTDTTNIRSTVSTGFRAPSPGQANIVNISTGVDNNIPITDGQIPPTNPLAVEFGGQPLQPEDSTNFSIGVATELGPIDLTADFYRIEMEDRILNSSNFEITEEEAARLEESGIAGARSIRRFTYYTNDMDTTNQGLEIVASTSYDWGDAGVTDFNGSWAWTDQELDDFTPDLLSRSGQLALTDEIPENRGNFRVNHNLMDWRFTLQANYYDEFLVVPSNNDPSQDYKHGADIIFGGEVSYTWRNNLQIIVGADNLFDTMPERVRNPSQFTSNPFVTSVSYSPNGRMVYTRLRFDL